MIRDPRGPVLRLAAFAASAAAIVTLSQAPVSGAFSAVQGNVGNDVMSAASFCTAPATTLTSAGDSWTDEANPGVNHQNDTALKLRSSDNGNWRIYTRFDLPSVPLHCDLVGAKLSYYNNAPTAGRSIQVYRVLPGPPLWTAAGITWSTQPGYTGAAATNGLTTSTPGWQEWDVEALVEAQYLGGANAHNGFVLRDSQAGTAADPQQVYYDRQSTTYRPSLVLTWG